MQTENQDPVKKHKADFYDQVRSDLKEIQAGSSDALRTPENLQAWHDQLVEIKQDIEFQLVKKKATLPFGDFQNWKHGALKFKNRVETRLREAKRLRAQFHQQGIMGSGSMPSNMSLRLLEQAAKLIPRSDEGLNWHEAYERFHRIRASGEYSPN